MIQVKLEKFIKDTKRFKKENKLKLKFKMMKMSINSKTLKYNKFSSFIDIEIIFMCRLNL